LPKVFRSSPLKNKDSWREIYTHVHVANMLSCLPG